MNVKYLLCYGLLLACSQLSAAEGLAEDFTITISDEEVPAFDAYTPVSAAFRAELAEEWKLATRDVVNVIPVERAPKLYAILQAIVREFATKMECAEPAVIVDVKFQLAGIYPTKGQVLFGADLVEQCIVCPSDEETVRRWRAFRWITAHEMGHAHDYSKNGTCRFGLPSFGERLSKLCLPATAWSYFRGNADTVTLALFCGGIVLVNWARYKLQQGEYYADRRAVELDDGFTPEETAYSLSLMKKVAEGDLPRSEERIRRALGNCRGGCMILAIKALAQLPSLPFATPSWWRTHPSDADRVAAIANIAVSRDTIAFDYTSATDKKKD